jgi:micrococcal nuclease
MKSNFLHVKKAAIWCVVIIMAIFVCIGLDIIVADAGSRAKMSTPFVSGVVAYVHDGDTITIQKSHGKRIKIRFYGVDCPETEKEDAWKAQPYSGAARAFVRELILNKQVAVRLNGDKSYDRLVGEVFYDGRSLSRELVKNGLAWWNKKYEPHDSDLKRLQHKARKKRIGLWKDARPVPPWVHRYRAQSASRRKK